MTRQKEVKTYYKTEKNFVVSVPSLKHRIHKVQGNQVRGKVTEFFIFSRSGKSQRNSFLVRAFQDFAKSHGKSENFEKQCSQYRSI